VEHKLEVVKLQHMGTFDRHKLQLEEQLVQYKDKNYKHKVGLMEQLEVVVQQHMDILNSHMEEELQ
jgi:hypothetical protein